MKKVTYLIIILLTIVTFSCEKEPSRALLPEIGFRVNIDAQNFEADRVAATIFDDAINITAFRGANNEAVNLILIGNSEGIYPLGVQNGTSINVGSYVEEINTTNGSWVSQTDGVSSQGTAIISEIDQENKTISGNFSFTGNNPSVDNADEFIKEFTNGFFNNIPYTGRLNTPPIINNTFNAKIDGDAFEEDLLSGTLTNDSGLQRISIVATKNNESNITLSFPTGISPGNYDFDIGTGPSGQYNILMPSTRYIADGSFSITSHDIANKRIIGTFSFIAEAFGGGASGSFEITEGDFDITYE